MKGLLVFSLLLIYILMVQGAHRNSLTLMLPLIAGLFVGILFIGIAAAALGPGLVPLLVGIGAAGGAASGILDNMRKR